MGKYLKRGSLRKGSGDAADAECHATNRASPTPPNKGRRVQVRGVRMCTISVLPWGYKRLLNPTANCVWERRKPQQVVSSIGRWSGHPEWDKTPTVLLDRNT